MGAHASDYTIEERIVTSTWVHERPRTGKTLEQVRTDYQLRFGREPPSNRTLLRLEQKLFPTGSVKDKPRSGRPSTGWEQCREVGSSPMKSTRKRSAELDIPRPTLRKHTEKGLKVNIDRNYLTTI
ncbi:hypothetical protein RI129_005910 [Pyrocoelia pectoralis]|uniref:DUF4817 domain-containing protein n=1 Tax=Pyrocoelia pectoralis TaxID=417401 RepID=A0AAN7VA98_9COLE